MYQRGFVSAVTRQSQAHCYTIIAAALTTAIADVGDTAVDIPAEPRGWYHARDVAQLAGVSAQTTKQWTRNGYILASRDIVGNQNIYSYQDVAEAMIIHASTPCIGEHAKVW